jgi:hypothetical protein
MSILVTHGDWIWKIAVGVGTLIAVASYQLVRGIRARSRISRVIQALSKRISAPRSGEVVLHGVFRGGTAWTLRNSAGEHASEITGVPWLDCDGTRIELTAELRVDHGTRREHGLWRAPAGTSPTLRARVRRVEPLVLESIGDGEELLIAGQLHQDGNTWRLAPTLGSATRARISPHPQGPIGLVGGPLAFTLALWGALTILGTTMLERASQEADRDAARYAAALPGSRARALTRLYELEYERGVLRDAETRRRRRELAQLAFGDDRACDDVPWQIEDLGDLALEAAEEAGATCGATHVADLLMLRGEHARARSRAPAGSRAAWIAAVLAADWRSAGNARSNDPAEQCVLDLFRWWSGDAAMAQTLAARATTSDTCAFAATETIPPSERTAFLHSRLGRTTLDLDLDRWRSLADGLLAPRPDRQDSLAIEARLSAIWFGPQIVRSWSPKPADANGDRQRALLFGHVFTAVLERMRGDHAAESTQLEAARGYASPSWTDALQAVPDARRPVIDVTMEIETGRQYLYWVDVVASRRDAARDRNDIATQRHWQRILDRHVTTLADDRRILIGVLLIRDNFTSLHWEGAR